MHALWTIFAYGVAKQLQSFTSYKDNLFNVFLFYLCSNSPSNAQKSDAWFRVEASHLQRFRHNKAHLKVFFFFLFNMTVGLKIWSTLYMDYFWFCLLMLKQLWEFCGALSKCLVGCCCKFINAANMEQCWTVFLFIYFCCSTCY